MEEHTHAAVGPLMRKVCTGPMRVSHMRSKLFASTTFSSLRLLSRRCSALRAGTACFRMLAKPCAGVVIRSGPPCRRGTTLLE